MEHENENSRGIVKVLDSCLPQVMRTEICTLITIPTQQELKEFLHLEFMLREMLLKFEFVIYILLFSYWFIFYCKYFRKCKNIKHF